MNLLSGKAADPFADPTIGIRPEHLQISRHSGSWPERVSISEHFGFATFIHAKSEFGVFNTPTNGEIDPHPRGAIWLSPVEANLHRFDKSGNAISAAN